MHATVRTRPGKQEVLVADDAVGPLLAPMASPLGRAGQAPDEGTAPRAGFGFCTCLVQGYALAFADVCVHGACSVVWLVACVVWACAWFNASQLPNFLDSVWDGPAFPSPVSRWTEVVSEVPSTTASISFSP